MPRPLDESLLSLEYWIARSSGAMTGVGVVAVTLSFRFKFQTARDAWRLNAVIPGWSEGPDPESRDSGFDAAHRPGMTSKSGHASAPPAAPLRPGCARKRPRKTRGRRECRAPNAPDSRVCNGYLKSAHALVRSHRNHPAFPTQWFTDYCALSPVLRAFWPPSSVKVSFHELDTSVGVSGPHAFSVRFKCPRLKAPSASTASRPAFATIMIRPFWWDGTEMNIG
jgi:hypothetical protein